MGKPYTERKVNAKEYQRRSSGAGDSDALFIQEEISADADVTDPGFAGAFYIKAPA
jgi:hypothetical protein